MYGSWFDRGVFKSEGGPSLPLEAQLESCVLEDGLRGQLDRRTSLNSAMQGRIEMSEGGRKFPCTRHFPPSRCKGSPSRSRRSPSSPSQGPGPSILGHPCAKVLDREDGYCRVPPVASWSHVYERSSHHPCQCGDYIESHPFLPIF